MYKSKIKKEFQVYHLEDKDYLILGDMWCDYVLLADPDNNFLSANTKKSHLETHEGTDPIGIMVEAKSDKHAVEHGLYGEFNIVGVSDVKLLIANSDGYERAVYPSRLKLVR